MTQQFTLVIERDPDTSWLVGEITELPGCYTQAENMAELEKNIREAIQVYLETSGDISPLPEFVGLQRIEVTV